MNKKELTKQEVLISEIWAFFVFFLAIAVEMLWISINWWFMLAFLGIFLSFCLLTLLSRKTSRKARIMMIRPFLYSETKRKILKMAFSIAAPFYFCLLCLATFPVQHYSIWFLVVLPTLIFFCIPLTVVANFCDEFKVSKPLFWITQLGMATVCICVGRLVASVLLQAMP